MSASRRSPAQDFMPRALRKQGSCSVPLSVSFPELREAGGEAFVAGLRDNAETVIPALGVACYQVRSMMRTDRSLSPAPDRAVAA